MRHHSRSPTLYIDTVFHLPTNLYHPLINTAHLNHSDRKKKGVEELNEITSLHRHIEGIRRDKQREIGNQSEKLRGRTPWGRKCTVMLKECRGGRGGWRDCPIFHSLNQRQLSVWGADDRPCGGGLERGMREEVNGAHVPRGVGVYLFL